MDSRDIPSLSGAGVPRQVRWLTYAWLRLWCWSRAIYRFLIVASPAISKPCPTPLLALRPRLALSPLFLLVPRLGLRVLFPCQRRCSLLALRGLRSLVPPAFTALASRSIVRLSAVPRRFCLLSRGFESPCLPFLAGRRSRLLLLLPVVVVESLSVRFAVRLRLHPLRSPCCSYPSMADGALGRVASALADAIPGGAPGDPVPGLLRAFAVLAGRGSSSQSSRGRRGGPPRHGRRGGSHQPVYRSPPGRTHAFLRPRQQQSFRRTRRQSGLPPPLPRSPRSLVPGSSPPPSHLLPQAQSPPSQPSSSPLPPQSPSVLQAAPPPSFSPLPSAPSASAVVLPAPTAPPALPLRALPQLFLGGCEIPRPCEVLSTPQPAAAPVASAAVPDEPCSRWEECPPVERLRRVEQRVATVGTVLELLALVLDQLHSGLLRGRVVCPPLSKRQRAVVVTAARRMMGSLPQMGLEKGSPGLGSGPGPSAVRRLASSVRRAPLDLVPAASALLRWLDGRLALILAD
ncbi:unnamed protein product [Closterium sp. NIES-65]|nr:unnamed protein product [Closterium sp. NIES-65]